ncbi:MAG: DNA adenine methylase [Patescibacteria group bacterium]|nr:DNA adenine methylase [Patescibacteria group bacterium]
MNYIGSKYSLLNFIDETIAEVTGDNFDTFCDIFAGTGVVGQHYKKKGHKVIANDMQYYSFVMNRHFIGNHKPLLFSGLNKNIAGLTAKDSGKNVEKVFEYLNSLDGKKGFIYNNYSVGGTEGFEYSRMYFTDANASKCDAIRTKIEEWKTSSLITEDEYFQLLASLIESTDKYANTASVYGAFLKQFKKSALADLVLKPLPVIVNKKEHEVHNKDSNILIDEIECDVLYLDPPYNERQYATNYHMLETIARNDNPTIKGKTGLREYQHQKSEYCSRGKVKEAFEDLIQKAKTKYIFVSYNNEGLLSEADLKEILSKKGEYRCFKKEYARYKADNNRDYKDNKTFEYLHCVVCK